MAKIDYGKRPLFILAAGLSSGDHFCLPSKDSAMLLSDLWGEAWLPPLLLSLILCIFVSTEWASFLILAFSAALESLSWSSLLVGD